MRSTTLRLCLAVPLLTGCTGAPPGAPFQQWIDSAPIPEGDPVALPPPGREAAPLPADIGVEDLVRLALERNPAIRAAENRVHRLANRIPQVTSLDDPMLGVTPIGEMAETAAGQVAVMSSVSQRLPFPGKLETKGRIAEQEVAEAMQRLKEVRIQVVADTRLAWWSSYDALRAIEVTERNRTLVAQFRDVADAKFRAGTTAQEDVLRASLELHNLDSELYLLAQRRTSSQAMLNQLIDRPVDAPIPAPPIRGIEEKAFELDALLREASKVHPAIRALQERVEAFRHRTELARLNRWPDLTASVSYNLVDSEGLSGVANGDDQWWIGLGVNLPIWTARLDAAEREALRGRLESAAALHAEMNRIGFRVQDALVKVQTHESQAKLFRDVIIPQAEQTVDASLSSYRAGNVEFLTLIDNWRKLLVFERTYHHHLAELERSFAELQRSVGHDLNGQAPAGTGPDAGAPNPIESEVQP